MHKLIVLLFVLLVSCKTHTIRLDVVRKTSDLLHCQKIYGYDAKELYEQNEILIQVGVIDTTTEQSPIKAAIIQINKTEITLNLLSYSNVGNRTIEKYSDDTYQLTLNYSTKKDEKYYGSYAYLGSCTITKGNLSSKYDIVGIANPGY